MSPKSQYAAAASLTIRDWIDQLIAVSEKDFTVSRIDQLVSLHRIRPDSLAPYIFYEGHYTRNLIYKSDFCEVLAICWDIGQESLPHDHAGNQCWMVTPIGRLRVQNFRVNEKDPRQRTCRLTPTNVFDMDADHPARVETEESVHRVLNLAEFGERATSVHIYSRSYSSCEVYDAETGVYWTKTLDYWSEHGRLSRAGDVDLGGG